MKNKIKVGIFALLFAVCVTAFSLTSLGGAPASANSARTYYSGVNSSGLIITTEECPIVVDSEMLTFDIETDDERFWQYDCGGKVTAKYTFRNPADYTVNVGLLFSAGFVSKKANDKGRDYSSVTANGVDVKMTPRYTYKHKDREDFDYAKDMQLLRDDCIKQGIYSADLSVHKYICDVHSTGQVARLDLSRYGGMTVSNATSCGYSSNRKLTFSLDAESETTYYKRVTIYFIGVDIEESFGYYYDVDIENGNLGSAVTYYDTSLEEECTGSVYIATKDEITYFDMIKELKAERSAYLDITDVDLYNVMVAKRCDKKKWETEPSDWTFDDYMDLGSDLICWYEYDLSFAPGETIINEVTAPLYPDVYTGSDPKAYTFNYYLSPAKTWASFGDLTIRINTSHYVKEPSLEGFKKYDGYYEYVGKGLPDCELKFTTCALYYPKYTGHTSLTWIIIVGVIILTTAVALTIIAILLTKRSKRRKKTN